MDGGPTGRSSTECTGGSLARAAARAAWPSASDGSREEREIRVESGRSACQWAG